MQNFLLSVDELRVSRLEIFEVAFGLLKILLALLLILVKYRFESLEVNLGDQVDVLVKFALEAAFCGIFVVIGLHKLS